MRGTVGPLRSTKPTDKETELSWWVFKDDGTQVRFDAIWVPHGSERYVLRCCDEGVMARSGGMYGMSMNEVQSQLDPEGDFIRATAHLSDSGLLKFQIEANEAAHYGVIDQEESV
jgi:hypothetical protein